MAAVPIRSWMNVTRSSSFSSVSTTEACEMPQDESSLSALDDQRQAKTCRTANLAVLREHREGRHRNPMVMHERLRQVLAARQHQAARIAAGIGNAQQFEIADDVLVVDGFAVELLEQVEHDIRLPVLDLVADRLELVCTPSGRTSCPAARSVLTTSYSVFQTLISCSVYPLLDSGGIRSGCKSTRTRRRFIARSTSAATDRRAHAPSWRSTTR